MKSLFFLLLILLSGCQTIPKPVPDMIIYSANPKASLVHFKGGHKFWGKGVVMDNGWVIEEIRKDSVKMRKIK